MKPTLVDVTLMSEKRTNVLMLLYCKGKKNIDEIKNTLDVSSSGIMPQMKKLVECDLLIHEKDTYELSDMGKLIVEKMQDLLSLSTLFEENHDYWKNRDLSKIPIHMLRRISELGQCSLLEPDRHHLFEHHPEFIEKIHDSKYVMMISSSFHPQTMSVLCDAAEKDIGVSFIVTRSVFDRMEEDCQNELERFHNCEHTELVIDNEEEEIGLLTLAVSDIFVYIWLFDKNQRFNRITLISYDESALNWGKELFMYYRNLATAVDKDNEIDYCNHGSNLITQNVDNSVS
ncbi:winged helix-turn-helix domain-containing protein [Methanolobus sp. ZRKC3]|uniref:helix-turn-helix transcriptional regulator n=1 Tax=Methanolobus sp. ZRKC3 TaxID=3125786 RepID=UPI003248E550